MTTYIVTIKAYGRECVMKVEARTEAEAIRKAQKTTGLTVEAHPTRKP